MKTSRVIACLLLALTLTTAAHSLTLPTLQRKGAIEDLYVQPDDPTTAAPVVLHVTAAEVLELDRVDINRIGNTFMVKVYWDEPATGSQATEPGHAQESLGLLAKGTYRLFVQSLYENRMVGSKQMSFQVAEVTSPSQGNVIDEVWVTPENPTTADNAYVHVSGKWPTTGFTRSLSLMRLSGRTAYVDLYWQSPGEGAVAFVITPFTYDGPLRLAQAGVYTVRVRIYLDGQLVDFEEISIEVAQSDGGSGWNWGDFFWGLDLP